MSEPTVDESISLTINGQTIEVRTQVFPGMKQVSYGFKSDKGIDPETAALSLYMVSCDICEKIGISIDELVDGVVESDEAMH